jgi:hypothetical protein
MMDDAERRAADWLTAADDEILACRATGHAFPKLRARSGKLPRGVAAYRQRDGAYMIESTCRDCGTVRTLVTLPGGHLDLPARYTYRWPEGYATPKGAGVTRRQALSELWDRTLDTITQEAGR